MSALLKPRILSIYLSSGHDFKGRHGMSRLNHGIESVESVECLAGRGLKGDRFFDYKEDFKGQVTFFDAGVAEWLTETLGLQDIDASLFRRNIVTEGVDLTGLVGKRFELGGVVFEGAEECAPCYWMNEAIGRGAEALLKGKGGLRCRIMNSGILKVGPVELKVLAQSGSNG